MLLISYFQIANSVAWVITALVLIPGTYRDFFGKMRDGDPWKAILFFVALVFVGGSTRFLVAPDDTTTWAAIYCLSVLCAAGVWITAWNMRRDR